MRFSRTEPVERCSEADQRVLRRDSLLVLHIILPGNCREVPLEELRPVSLLLVFPLSYCGGYQGRCEGVLYAIQLNYGVSGTIWGIIVQDTMKVVGIGNDVKGFCTQYIQIMGYRERCGAFLYGMHECFVGSVGEKSYISG